MDANPLSDVRSRSPRMFFVVVWLLAIPFWIVGAATGIVLLPGLPLAALTTICPMTAALILVYRTHKIEGVSALLKRSFDYQRIRAHVWFVPILFLNPGVMLASYGLMRLMGTPVPTLQFPVLTALVLFIVFFIGALGEELGWSGYVTEPMQDQWGALVASLALGLVWAAIHFVPLLQAHRLPAWIAWWSLGTVAARVLIVWLYNNTNQSVFAVALCHAMGNVSWQLFPVHGSYYDPRVSGIIAALVAGVVAILWEPRTLARFRLA